MVAPIAAIGAIAPLSTTSSVAGPTGAAGATGATGAASTSGASFATALGNGLDAVTGAQQQADSLAVQASTGTLVDPAQYTIAATQAQLMTQLATTIESKAVAAFNTVMGMQA
ncbi:MAG: flagellar hook-basal body complex protein FliE [Pseudonocardiales bacterium]|nr:flagellar hook-basal body complex protein FliE [Pseudonocardiales bacterium]